MTPTAATSVRILAGWLVVLIFVLLLRAGGWLQASSLAAFDAFSIWAADSQPSPDLVIIGISDRDFERWGMPPFPDRAHVEIFEAIFASEPTLVSWAAFKSYPVGEGAEALDALARRQPNWWLANVPKVAQFDGVTALPAFEEANRTGHILQHVDKDNVIRRLPLSLAADDGTRHSLLALDAALEYLRLRGESTTAIALDSEGALLLGGHRYPQTNSGFGEYVDSGDGADLPTLLVPAPHLPSAPVYSARELVEGQIDPALLRGKLVVVGLVSQQVTRPFMTALSRSWFDSPQWLGPAELHARQIESILALARGQARPFAAPGQVQVVFGLGLFGLLVMAGLTRATRLRQWCAIGLGAGLLVVAAGYVAHLQFLWLPVVPALSLVFGLWLWRVGVGLQDATRVRERSRLLQRIIDVLPDPMLVIDSRGRLCFDNLAFRRLRLHQTQFRLLPTGGNQARLELPLGEAVLTTELLGGFRLCRLVEYRRRPAPRADSDVWPKMLSAAADALDQGMGLRLVLIESAPAEMPDADGTDLDVVAEAALDARLNGRFYEDVLVSIGTGRWLLLRPVTADSTAELLDRTLSWPVVVGGDTWQPRLYFAELELAAGNRPRPQDLGALQERLEELQPSPGQPSLDAFEQLRRQLLSSTSDTARGTGRE
jgi:CHASE2 domain-containing sensor protein